MFQGEEDHNLLFHSVKSGNKQAFDVVLKRSDVNWQNDKGTPREEGGHNKHLLLFPNMLISLSYSYIISSGTSALYSAVKEKKHNITEALLKAGASPSPKLKKDGSTPLHISAYYKAKDLGIAELLLQYKADANAQ